MSEITNYNKDETDKLLPVDRGENKNKLIIANIIKKKKSCCENIKKKRIIRKRFFYF